MCSGFIWFYLELWSSMGDNIFFDMNISGCWCVYFVVNLFLNAIWIINCMKHCTLCRLQWPWAMQELSFVGVVFGTQHLSGMWLHLLVTLRMLELFLHRLYFLNYFVSVIVGIFIRVCKKHIRMFLNSGNVMH
jgi:hypothetical protein